MASTSSQKSKARPERSRMDSAQNSVIVKLVERVDKLSAIFGDNLQRNSSPDFSAAPVCNVAAMPKGPPSIGRSIPESMMRLREAVDRLREYRHLHSEIYAPVIMPAAVNQSIGAEAVNPLSNCDVSCSLNDLADSIFAITADLRDMAERTQL